jgi:hypothetical protein
VPRRVGRAPRLTSTGTGDEYAASPWPSSHRASSALRFLMMVTDQECTSTRFPTAGESGVAPGASTKSGRDLNLVS